MTKINYPAEATTALPVFYRTYSRRKDVGRETIEECKSRQLKGLQELGDYTDEEYELIKEMLLNNYSMTSGRWHWVGGTEWVKNPANFYGSYNCSTIDIESWDDFGHNFNFLMQGCGVGTTVELRNVDNLPTIKSKINLYFIGEPGDYLFRHDDNVYSYSPGRVEITVGDTRQAWVETYKKLLEVASDKIGTMSVVINLSNIRSDGSKINGFGGIANPVGFKPGLIKLVNVINKAVGRKLNSLELSLALCIAGYIAVAGNVRRCVVESQMVVTDSSLKQIKDIQVGDKVLTSSGEYKAVTAVFDQSVQEVIEIITDIGSIKVTPNHRMAVYDTLKSYTWINASDLTNNHRLITIPHSKGVDTCNYDWAWLVGYYCGNGHADIEKAKIRNGGGGYVAFAMSTSAYDNGTGEKITRILESIGYNPSSRVKENQAAIYIYKKDLAEKFIKIKSAYSTPIVPDYIINGSEDIRAAFLAGLMDSDGQNDNRNILVNSTKIEFLKQVQLVSATLGIITKLNIRQPKKLYKYPGKVYEGCHYLSIRGLDSQKLAYKLLTPHLTRCLITVKTVKKNGLTLPKQVLENTEGLTKTQIASLTNVKTADKTANFDSLIEYGLVNANWKPVKVLDIVNIPPAHTYDIEVEDNHEFVCNGLLIHNSARINQGSSNDDIFTTSKDNLWINNNGSWVLQEPEYDVLTTANHTRVYHHKPTLEECINAVNKQYYSSEGAIQYAPEAIARCNVDILDTREKQIEFINEYEKDPVLGKQCLTSHYFNTYAQRINSKELDHRIKRYQLNPCLTGDTLVHTRNSDELIKNLIGKTVEIWDGVNWVTVDNFRVTGFNQEIWEITLSCGDKIKATKNHTFILANNFKRQLQDLKIGDRLLTDSYLAEHDPKFYCVSSISYVGVEELVYCCTVSTNNRFTLANGVIVGNCGEIIGGDLLCNLGEIHLNLINPSNFKLQNDAFISASLTTCALLKHKFDIPKFAYSREIDPIVGVSFTGLFDFFVNAFGEDWLLWWKEGRPNNWKKLNAKLDINNGLYSQLIYFKFIPDVKYKYWSDLFTVVEQAYLTYWKDTVKDTVFEYCDKHNLKRPNRYTAIQPSGTKSLLTNASPGWHPPKASRYIRRITFKKNDPVALACLDYGYSVIPSVKDKQLDGALYTDPFNDNVTEWLLEIPCQVSWAEVADKADLNPSLFSAKSQFDFAMQVQKYYVTHNTSATLEFRKDEIEELGTLTYNAIKNNDGYISAALMARYDDYQSHPRLPFEPITKEQYDNLILQVLERRVSDNFEELLLKYDQQYQGEFLSPEGCDGSSCLLSSNK